MYEVELWCPGCGVSFVDLYKNEEDGVAYFDCPECGTLFRVWITFKCQAVVNGDPKLV